MISMRVSNYIKEVILPILKVLIIAPALPLLVYLYLDKTALSFFLVLFVSIPSVLLVSYFVGCKCNEQKYIKNLILAKILR